MHKQPEKSSVSTIIISALVSLLILGVITYFAITYLIPNQTVSVEVLYTVLIRLLPMLIGLIMVLIAIVLYPPSVPKDTDSDDELALDDFTAPLYNLPQEEDAILLGRPQLAVSEAQELPTPPRKEEQSAAELHITPFSRKQSFTPFSERQVPVKLEPVTYPTTTIGTPSVEEDLIETPSLEEQFDEVAVEVSALVSSDPLERLTRPVLFSEYPFPITPGTEIAELLEPIEETTLEAGEELILIEDTFENRYEAEFASAQEMEYEFTLAIIAIPPATEGSQGVDVSVVQNLFNKIGLVSFFYLTEENIVSAILPFHGFAQSRRYFASLLESLRKNNPMSGVKIGFSTLRGRDISAEELLREASIAAEQATSREGYSVIAYDVELEA